MVRYTFTVRLFHSQQSAGLTRRYQGEVYDFTGTYISALQLHSQAGGIGTTLTWAGNDTEGLIVPGGTYVYRINGEGQSFTGTVGVAR